MNQNQEYRSGTKRNIWCWRGRYYSKYSWWSSLHKCWHRDRTESRLNDKHVSNFQELLQWPDTE